MLNSLKNKINNIHIYVWDKIQKVTLRISPPPRYYIAKYQYHKNNPKNTEVNFLIEGVNRYPKNYRLLLATANYFCENKKWKRSLKYWSNLFKYHHILNEKLIVNYSKSLQKCKDVDKAIFICEKGLITFPNSKLILNQLYNLYIFKKNWLETNVIFNKMEKLNFKIPKKTLIKRAMILQLFGDSNGANEIYRKTFGESSTNDYSVIEIYNNGESSIEFYKKHSINDKVCLTFDSINITWDDVPFGFKVLINERVDIIALRRRRTNSYHQDLSNDQYYGIVHKLVDYYNGKLAYGFSLGGYTSLYYGSSINAHILSISPRNSTHPIFGVSQISKENFTHNIRQDKNLKIKPIILYDEKNQIDREYIDELKLNYPNGQFISHSYSGHRIVPFLHQIGILKEKVQNFIRTGDIKLERNLNKAKSYQYLRVLGTFCLNRNKPNWALDIGINAVRINSNDVESNILAIKSLIILDKEEEALEIINNFLKNNKNKSISLYKVYLDLKKEYTHSPRLLNLINRKINSLL